MNECDTALETLRERVRAYSVITVDGVRWCRLCNRDAPGVGLEPDHRLFCPLYVTPRPLVAKLEIGGAHGGAHQS